jgi:hypothetical protein
MARIDSARRSATTQRFRHATRAANGSPFNMNTNDGADVFCSGEIDESKRRRNRQPGCHTVVISATPTARDQRARSPAEPSRTFIMSRSALSARVIALLSISGHEATATP